jgi:hypothetical protein
MTTKKPIFLLSKAVAVEPSGTDCRYDSDLQLNVLISDGITPLVDSGENLPTMSKTHAHPGDDDPDPGQDKCY